VATEVFVHIGPPKTGTTYLQEVLWRNRERLAARGLLVPGPSPVSQFHAVVDLLDDDPTELGADRVATAWERLVRQVHDWEGSVVVSHENLARAAPAIVERARADLAGSRLHVVTTVRAPHAVAPAAWQERLKNRGRQTWPEFMTELAGPSPFWHQHAGEALRWWTAGMDPADVHVVTVPPSGTAPTLLWERFATVLGVDPHGIDTAVPRSNTSVGADGAAYLRRVNEELEREVDWAAYRIGVKQALAGVLSTRTARIPVQVGAADRAMFRERARQFVQTIREAGYHVVGDLEDLTSTSVTGSPQQVDNAVPDQALDQVAHDSVIGLIGVITETRRELHETRRELHGTQQQLRRVTARLELTEQQLNAPRMRLVGSRLTARSGLLRRMRERIRRSRHQAAATAEASDPPADSG